MKKTELFLSVIFIFAVFSFSYGTDWKKLHEEADRLSLSEIQGIIKKSGETPENLYLMGLIYLNLHENKKAGLVFDKILQLSPSSYEAKWGEAEVLRRQHKLEESQKLLEGIIKENPGYSPAYISLSYIKYTRMKFNEAVRLADFVIDQGINGADSSNYVRAILIVAGSKGMIAHYGGPISKLINGTAVFPNLKKAEKLNPDNPAVLFGMGSFYLLAPTVAGGNIEKAKEYLERVIKIDPKFSDAYVRLAQYYKVKADMEKYNTYLDKALEIDPGNEVAVDIKKGDCKFICLGD